MEYDVLIIGAGPAGYVAAIRAGQVGLKTAIVEKTYIGGMCLNYGCIPTKALLESAKVFEKTKHAAGFGVDGIDLEKLSFNWNKAKSRSTGITKKLTAGINYLLKKKWDRNNYRHCQNWCRQLGICRWQKDQCCTHYYCNRIEAQRNGQPDCKCAHY